MSALRVLQVFGEPFSNGGQDSYIMNMYRHIDRARVQFDFFTPFTIRNESMAAEVTALGGRMEAAGYPFGEDNNRYFTAGLTAYLATHRYDIVHIHSGSTYALMMGARLARRHGARRVAVHSHCGGFMNLKYRVIRLLSRRALMTYPTDYFACSHLAARWKFPTPIIREGRYRVLHNAVDTTRFRYSPALRDDTRRALGLTDKLVVGHIGRFATQKNHRYLVEIFAALADIEPRAHLVLVGYGDLEAKTLADIDARGLSDRVSFLGVRQDAHALMNAFDVFLLPSLFEGLPVVGVEAQATGLPVVTSDAVTPELPIPRLAVYKPLADPPTDWARAVLAAAATERRDTTDEMVAAGYDVRVAAARMQRIYEEMV